MKEGGHRSLHTASLWLPRVGVERLTTDEQHEKILEGMEPVYILIVVVVIP